MSAARQNRSPAWMIAWAGAALFVISPALTMVAPQAVEVSAYDTEMQREARNASSFAQMLGEFRTSLGDMLFIKTERYMDSGVGYEPHISADDIESSGLAETALTEREGSDDVVTGDADHDHADHEGHDHEEHAHEDDDHGDDHSGHDHGDHEGHDHGSFVQTLIKTADHDFRGFIGHMERQVKPWRDPKEPHQHTDDTQELLPWYRLATLSDPHNVRNYVIGAYWLKTLKTDEQLAEALKFVNEGIANNPDAYELHLMKGYILRQSDELETARKSFAESAQLGLKERPATGPVDEPGQWDITDEEQLMAAMHMHIMLTRDLESTATAIGVARRYVEEHPTEGALKRVLHDLESGN